MGEKPSIDDKTAVLIEQTEKSLRQMEETLGHDHPVVAQILDTYAKILRQANIRPLDAVNMEARARAIRAKHNINAADAQARAIESEEPAQSSRYAGNNVSAGTVRAVFWGLAILVTLSMCVFVYQALKGASKDARRDKQISRPVKKTGEPANAVENTAREPAPVSEANPETPGEETTEAGDETSPEEPIPALEQAKSSLGVKAQIAELVAHGEEQEEADNLDKALELYQTAVATGSQASHDLGHPVVSDPLVRAFEGCARILRARGDTERAAEHEQHAAGVRRILESQAE